MFGEILGAKLRDHCKYRYLVTLRPTIHTWAAIGILGAKLGDHCSMFRNFEGENTHCSMFHNFEGENTFGNSLRNR